MHFHQVREYEDKFDKLEKNYDATRKEMVSLKEAVRGLMGNTNEIQSKLVITNPTGPSDHLFSKTIMFILTST